VRLSKGGTCRTSAIGARGGKVATKEGGASFNQWKNNECAIGIENLDIDVYRAIGGVYSQLRTLSSLHPMFR
jgi:hypothetical protein